MSITVDKIRAKYPEPVTREENDLSLGNARGYCVGGAFCMFVGVDRDRFPYPGPLAKELRKCNKQLTQRWALILAKSITKANDAYDFELAWQRLGEALSYRRLA